MFEQNETYETNMEVERETRLIVFIAPEIAPRIVNVNSAEDLSAKDTQLQYTNEQRGLELTMKN